MTENHEIFLKAGEFYFGAGQVRISTLLGSCVTVTLWHPRRQLGGMCHFMLPGRPRLPGKPLDGHYADEAFALFDQAISRRGTRAGDYEAKLFGGGNMFPHAFTAANQDVGSQNIQVARELLASRGISLVSENVGGAGHRKLYFDIWSGEVWMSFQNVREAAHG